MKYFTFNNQTRSYLKIERGSKRPVWAPIRRDMINIPGRVGALLISSEVEPRSIDIPVRIKGENIADLQKLKEDLADWLVHNEVKELVFDDEPDRTYYAVVDGTLDLDEIVYYGKGVITFICPDGVKYGPLREIKLDAQTNKIYYAGTAPTIPTIKMTATKPLTYIGYSNGDDFVAMGSAVTEGATPVPENTIILSDDFSNLGLWLPGSSIEDTTISGSFSTGPRGLYVRDFGAPGLTGWAWYGPMIERSLSQSLTDFEIDVYLDNINEIDELSRMDLYLKNENGVIFGRITLADVSSSIKNNSFYSWIGNSVNDRLFLAYRERKEWNPFHGMLRFRKIGNIFEVYAASLDKNGMHYATHSSRLVDGENKYIQRLAGIAVQISKNAGYKTPNESFFTKVVVKRPNASTDNTVKNVAETGDVIEVKDGLIYKNGEVCMDRFHASSNFFSLRKGENSLTFTDGVEATVSFREAFK